MLFYADTHFDQFIFALSDFRAAVLCIPAPAISGLPIEGFFDNGTLVEIECDVTFATVLESSNIENISALAVLSSQPDTLTNKNISIATTTLARYLNNSQEEVRACCVVRQCNRWMLQVQ